MHSIFITSKHLVNRHDYHHFRAISTLLQPFAPHFAFSAVFYAALISSIRSLSDASRLVSHRFFTVELRAIQSECGMLVSFVSIAYAFSFSFFDYVLLPPAPWQHSSFSYKSGSIFNITAVWTSNCSRRRTTESVLVTHESYSKILAVHANWPIPNLRADT